MEHGGQFSWSGRGTVEAAAGDVMTVNPNELHDGLGRKGQARRWRMLFFKPDAISTLLERPAGAIAIENPVIQSAYVSQTVRAAVNAVTDPLCDQAEAEERLLVAVRATLRAVPPDVPTVHLRPSIAVQRVIAKIEAEFDLPLSLHDFSTATGLSRFQVLRRFSKEVGITPHGFLTQLRVKRAKNAILSGHSLAEAAIAVGFADQSHMTRAFARQFGTTPGRYLAACGWRDCNILQS